MGSFDFCAHCRAFSDLVFFAIDEHGSLKALCRGCRSGKTKAPPDVYFNPKDGHIQREENIADKNGDPIPFWDKTSKKAAMDKAGVREAGDSGPRHAIKPGKTKYFFT